VLFSKRARAERALAAERRIHGGVSTSSATTPSGVEDNMDSADEKEHAETDQDRRLTLLETIDQKDLDSLKTAEYNSAHDDFILPSAGPSRQFGDFRDAQIVHDSGEGSARDFFPNRPGGRKNYPSTPPRKRQKTLQSELPFVGNESDIEQTRFMAPAIAKEPEGAWDCLICTL
jgi:hypothetical protein